MPIRITGMNSGLDTESIITALTQRQKDKVTKHTGDQKKLTWKMDKWKDLNKKMVSFYNGTLSNMRFSSAYTKKTTTASNANAVSVVTGDGAMATDQTLDITSLAKSAFLTGNDVKTTSNEGAKKSTTMSELGLTSGTLQFAIGGNNSDLISVDYEATDSISDVLSKLQSASSSVTGTKLNFNYDENNNRFFVSAKSSGDSYNFAAVNSDAAEKLGFNSTNYVSGSDAKIKLNGVEYTSKSNTFNINGLTITANEVASGITLSTKQDTSGIYDNIKKMLKEYNSIMKEFATLYNADAAKKYKMLTDEQKDEMSDEEVKDWENKIKDGLLSGDETISNIRTGLRGITNKGFDVKLSDGTTKTLTLASFGIATGSYFSTEENERDALHIDGDKEDSLTSGNTDLLTAMISSDPDAVQSFFQQFSNAMYTKVSDLMKGTTYSSAFTIYEDKLMASQYSAYNTKINDAQKALDAAQDKLYSKFTRMETALSKINSSSSSLSGFFGGGSQ
ncbi:flagellar filament capping protein FliD [Butyrivibrio sp. YAB3001]|uniref:flagellar filament capping protein FliD n=1 Tax=Butyrivibrio sp. YAB3001 TaxID=1520812 RepID=UPI0008F669C6|nr:flagellar filament capping protein FliD [Butyrivibrio sp. YAB3001]SFB95441.1 flagellar hook-associated protein 2 [Butyrivibrio sp. YAB3001]